MLGSVPRRSRRSSGQLARPRRAARAEGRGEGQDAVVVRTLTLAALARSKIVPTCCRRVARVVGRHPADCATTCSSGSATSGRAASSEAVVDRVTPWRRVDEGQLPVVVVCVSAKTLLPLPSARKPWASWARPWSHPCPGSGCRSPAIRPRASRRGASRPPCRTVAIRLVLRGVGAASQRGNGRRSGSPSSRRRCGPAHVRGLGSGVACLAAACSRSVPAGSSDAAPASRRRRRSGRGTRGGGGSSFTLGMNARGTRSGGVHRCFTRACARRQDSGPVRRAALLLACLALAAPAASARADDPARYVFSHVVESCSRTSRPTAPSRTPAARPGWRGCARRASTCRSSSPPARQPGQLRGVVRRREPTTQGKSDCLASRSAPHLLSDRADPRRAAGRPGPEVARLQRGHDRRAGRPRLPARAEPRRAYQGPGTNGYATRPQPRAVVRQRARPRGSEDYAGALGRPSRAVEGRASASRCPVVVRRARHLNEGHDTRHDRRVHAGSEGPGARAASPRSTRGCRRSSSACSPRRPGRPQPARDHVRRAARATPPAAAVP